MCSIFTSSFVANDCEWEVGLDLGYIGILYNTTSHVLHSLQGLLQLPCLEEVSVDEVGGH